MAKDRFERGARELRRRAQKRFSGNTFLIVTEGAKTEPNYLKALCNRLHLTAAQIEVLHPSATDPLNLVHYAIQRKREAESEKRRGTGVGFDEVWVVFDLEKIHDERRHIAMEAIQIGKSKGISLAVSNPAFEFWLLCHFNNDSSLRILRCCCSSLEAALAGLCKGIGASQPCAGQNS